MSTLMSMHMSISMSVHMSTHTTLQATLVWMDAPGSTLSETALVNDLDLVLLDGQTNRTILRGNHMLNGPDTIEHADRLNNVEKLHMPTHMPTPMPVHMHMHMATHMRAHMSMPTHMHTHISIRLRSWRVPEAHQACCVCVCLHTTSRSLHSRTRSSSLVRCQTSSAPTPP